MTRSWILMRYGSIDQCESYNILGWLCQIFQKKIQTFGGTLLWLTLYVVNKKHMHGILSCILLICRSRIKLINPHPESFQADWFCVLHCTVDTLPGVQWLWYFYCNMFMVKSTVFSMKTSATIIHIHILVHLFFFFKGNTAGNSHSQLCWLMSVLFFNTNKIQIPQHSANTSNVSHGHDERRHF